MARAKLEATFRYKLEAGANFAENILASNMSLTVVEMNLSFQAPKPSYSLSTYVMSLVSINLLNTKRRPLYLKTQFVPRSKHFSSRL